MRIYLAGAITDIVDPTSWRRAVTKQLPDGWEAVDPTLFKYEDDNELVAGDLKAIENCDAVLALINTPSWGTGMEIFYANQLKIPVIGWNPSERLISPWVRVHCEDILSDFEDIKVFLQNLLVKA